MVLPSAVTPELSSQFSPSSLGTGRVIVHCVACKGHLLHQEQKIPTRQNSKIYGIEFQRNILSFLFTSSKMQIQWER